MINHLHTSQWILLIVGIIFLIISVFTLFRSNKRDKIISISVFSICLICYVYTAIYIRNHYSKAHIYYGIHELSNYNGSAEYKLEIFPDQTYQVFNDHGTVSKGSWDLSVSNDKSTRLILDRGIFGVGDFDIK